MSNIPSIVVVAFLTIESGFFDELKLIKATK